MSNLFVNDKSKGDLKSYEASLKKIKRELKGIILSVREIPAIGNNKVVIINDLEEMVDMVVKIKKSIYYIESVSCCDFILISDDTYYVYTLKASDEIKSLFENEYCKFKMQETDQSKLLDDVDSTSIIKINNGKCFKVSPIKK